MRDDETMWVVRAQVGDREALEQLLRAAGPIAHRYVSNVVGAADPPVRPGVPRRSEVSEPARLTMAY